MVEHPETRLVLRGSVEKTGLTTGAHEDVLRSFFDRKCATMGSLSSEHLQIPAVVRGKERRKKLLITSVQPAKLDEIAMAHETG